MNPSVVLALSRRFVSVSVSGGDVVERRNPRRAASCHINLLLVWALNELKMKQATAGEKSVGRGGVFGGVVGGVGGVEYLVD